MILYSASFFLFFVITSLAVHFVPTVRGQHLIFLLANIVFYASWDYRFLLLLFGVIIVCYWTAILYKKTARQAYITCGVVICLLTLGVFKYLNFFLESISKLQIHSLNSLKIILPLGLSFYLFQAISYILDVKNGMAEAEQDFLKLAAYLSFFPQISSGPIMKAHDFLPQLDRIHRIRKDNLYLGLQLFVTGLTKKLVIANRIGTAVDAVYSAPLAYNWVSVIFAILGYSIQIYCDFSGYSDMAIGLATIWDFNFGKNFNMPYLAENPSDFWRRWHISLSTWFRDYVYIPLGGNRKGECRTYLNLFITMVLSGIWHGAGLTFIVWGVIHGIAIVIYRFLINRQLLQRKGNTIQVGFSILMNFLFISVAWVFFRSESLTQAFTILSGITRNNGVQYISVYTVVYTVLLLIPAVYSMCFLSKNTPVINMNLDKSQNIVLFSVWIFLIIMMMHSGDSPFIYMQF